MLFLSTMFLLFRCVAALEMRFSEEDATMERRVEEILDEDCPPDGGVGTDDRCRSRKEFGEGFFSTTNAGEALVAGGPTRSSTAELTAQRQSLTTTNPDNNAKSINAFVFENATPDFQQLVYRIGISKPPPANAIGFGHRYFSDSITSTSNDPVWQSATVWKLCGTDKHVKCGNGTTRQK